MREDYSEDGDAWDYFTHDQARSRAYRWGEDGMAGISDDQQRLCFALALWNGRDPILKERLFGLTNSEGNHGEDVKEYYFYLDSTPTHSYMKYLYKYPQAAFPYADLVETNRRRRREELEYELLDTGVFDDDRYFDVVRRVCQGRPGRHPDPDHRDQPRAGSGRAAPAADALVPQRLVVVAAPSRPRSPSSSRSTGRRASSVVAATHPTLGHVLPVLRGRRRRCCSPRTRPTTRGSSPSTRTPAPTSRTASTTTWSTGSRRRSTPTGAAPRWPRTTG